MQMRYNRILDRVGRLLQPRFDPLFGCEIPLVPRLRRGIGQSRQEVEEFALLLG